MIFAARTVPRYRRIWPVAFILLGALVVWGVSIQTASAQEPPPGPSWPPAIGGSSAAVVATGHVPGCPEVPTFQFEVSDPVGDAVPFFGMGTTVHDITNVSGEGDDTTFCLTIDFAGQIEPPSELSPQSVIVIGEFDLDEDASTGVPPLLDELCPDRIGIGTDAFLIIAEGPPVLVLLDGSGEVITVTYEATSLTAVMPVSVLGDGAFNFGIGVGTFEESTDCAPNGGSIHSPEASPPINGFPTTGEGPLESQGLPWLGMLGGVAGTALIAGLGLNVRRFRHRNGMSR